MNLHPNGCSLIASMGCVRKRGVAPGFKPCKVKSVCAGTRPISRPVNGPCVNVTLCFHRCLWTLKFSANVSIHFSPIASEREKRVRGGEGRKREKEKERESFTATSLWSEVRREIKNERKKRTMSFLSFVQPCAYEKEMENGKRAERLCALYR